MVQGSVQVPVAGMGFLTPSWATSVQRNVTRGVTLTGGTTRPEVPRLNRSEGRFGQI